MWAPTRKIMSVIIILIFSGCFRLIGIEFLTLNSHSNEHTIWFRSKPITVFQINFFYRLEKSSNKNLDKNP